MNLVQFRYVFFLLEAKLNMFLYNMESFTFPSVTVHASCNF